MKVNLLYFFILPHFFLLHLKAQNDSSELKRQSFITFSVGKSLPVGSFKKPFRDIGGIENGGALPGLNLELGLNYPFNNSRWGITSTMQYYSNGLDSSALVNNLGHNISVTSYKQFNILLGTSLAFPVKKIFFDLKLFPTGVLISNFPSISYAITYSPYAIPPYLNTDNTYNIHSKHSSMSYAWGLGLDMKYNITKYFLIVLNADFLHARTVFRAIKQENNPSDSYDISYKIDVNIASFKAGIGYQF